MLYPSWIESIAAGFGCLALTVFAVSYVISFQHDWYVSVSWLMTALSAISLAAIGLIEGGIAAASFLATYVLVAVAPLCFGVSVICTDALATMLASVIAMTVELACLLAYQNLAFFSRSSVVVMTFCS